MSKDIATLENECRYLEKQVMDYKVDHAVMRMFIGELLSPESLGYAVSPEVRQRASELLRRLKA